jgi:hypothetical protein
MKKIQSIVHTVLFLSICLLPLNANADKWALLVGINDYIDQRIPDLKGCESDIDLVKDILTTKYGFPETHVKQLKSRQATRENLIEAFSTWLIEKPSPGDVVLFYFSGHGTQIPDADGDEKDGEDEALCPADTGVDTQLNVLTDDELQVLLGQIPTQNVTVVFDSCHSGTATRDLVFVGNLLQQPRVLQRDLILAAKPPATRPVQRESDFELENPNHVFISACDAHELAMDAPWQTPDGGYFYAGALTKNLIDQLKAASADMTYRDLIRKVSHGVRKKSDQTPQLEGNAEMPIFFEQTPGESSIPIAGVEAGRVQLGAGAIHGVTKGSVYAISPAQDSQFANPRGQLRISTLKKYTSTGVVIEGDPKEIKSSWRAFEVQHAYPDQKLYIHLDAHPSDAQTFRQHLNLSDVAFVSENQYADLFLKLTSTEGAFSGQILFPDGRRNPAVTAPTLSALAEKLRRSIESLLVIKLLGNFQNPNPSFKLDVWVDKPDPPIYHIGEAVTMHFRSERDCHLILLNVDTEGYVTLMFPNRYHPDDQIRGGKTYTIPTKEMGFRIEIEGSPGRELVMALATTKPLSEKIFKPQNPPELFPDLTGANLGTTLVRHLSEALGGDSHSTLPTEGWAVDSLIADIKKPEAD